MGGRWSTGAAIAAALATLAFAAAGQAASRADGPRLTRPVAGAKARSSAVVFRWAARAGERYEVRIARDRAFTRELRSLRVSKGHARAFLPRGTWYWKVRRRGGLSSRWSARRRLRVVPRTDILPPSRPGPLVASSVAENSVAVSFGRALDEFGVAGYRVEANGAVVSTTAATTALVTGLPCGTKLTLAARAFDAAGNRSVPSPVANVRTRACSDLLAPIAPAALAATSITSTGVALQWPAGSDFDGGLVGYVVTRNGVELGRPLQTGFHVTNLAPATTYTFAVRSRDRVGHVSPGLASVTVTTAAPVAATGPLHAFLLASTDRSFQDAQEHYQQISVCYPTYFHVLGDDTLSGSDDPLITGWLRLRGIEVVPRVELSDRPLLHALLIDPAKRTRVATAIAARAAAHGYDGINLDFENGQIADRAFLTAFVQELAGLLHAQGQTLSVDVRPKYRELATAAQYFYDYVAIAAAADEVFVMAWDLHWSTSPAGAIADLVWVNRILTYLDTLPNRDRYTVGTQFYGFDWPLGGTATALEYPDIIALRDRVGATSQWHATAAEPYFTYTEGGLRHDVWYANADSVQAHYAAIRLRGYGIGAWRLGREDPLIWTKESLQP